MQVNAPGDVSFASGQINVTLNDQDLVNCLINPLLPPSPCAATTS